MRADPRSMAMKGLGIASGRKTLGEAIRRFTFPLPEDQATQGFKPPLYIRTLRKFAGLLIAVLRLNGVNRFSNEFIQALDPKLVVDLPGQRKMVLRTGHGRLIWRARTFLEEEPMLIEWINGFGSDDIFYDVGANVGCYTVYAGQLGIKTLAFEPELNNVQLLYENIFMNGLQERCIPIPIALGKQTGMDVFYIKSISKGDALHSIGRKSYLLNDPSTVTDQMDTLVMRLDDAIKTFGLPHPTRLKVDVDYNELPVMQGAVDTLQNLREVYVEIDPKLEEHQELVGFLESLSFRVTNRLETPRQWNNEISNYLFARD